MMKEVRGDKDQNIKLFNTLVDAIQHEREKPGALRLAFERAFESTYARMEKTDFVSVYQAPPGLDEDDREKFKSFCVGLLFGNWLATAKGFGLQQSIRDDELT
jgi:hypothetical protein